MYRKQTAAHAAVRKRSQATLAATLPAREHTTLSVSVVHALTSLILQGLTLRALVEKRYRSTLNDRYATLARLVSQPETQEICRTLCKDWEVPSKLDSSSSSHNAGKDKDPTKRQSKTTTLSVAIDTIQVLSQCCAQKGKELQNLLDRLKGIVHSVPGTSDEATELPVALN